MFSIFHVVPFFHFFILFIFPFFHFSLSCHFFIFNVFPFRFSFFDFFVFHFYISKIFNIFNILTFFHFFQFSMFSFFHFFHFFQCFSFFMLSYFSSCFQFCHFFLFSKKNTFFHFSHYTHFSIFSFVHLFLLASDTSKLQCVSNSLGSLWQCGFPGCLWRRAPLANCHADVEKTNSHRELAVCSCCLNVEPRRLRHQNPSFFRTPRQTRRANDGRRERTNLSSVSIYVFFLCRGRRSDSSHGRCSRTDLLGRLNQMIRHTHMNHASGTHPMKMGVFSRRVSLKLNSSRAEKIFGQMLVTTDDRVAQRNPQPKKKAPPLPKKKT